MIIRRGQGKKGMILNFTVNIVYKGDLNEEMMTSITNLLKVMASHLAPLHLRHWRDFEAQKNQKNKENKRDSTVVV